MADEIRATPRSPILGLFSDIVNLPLEYMSSPERTQQSQGVAQFLYGTGIPKTLERMSYGDSLFSGSGMTLRPKEETINAAMNVAPLAPVAGRVAGRMIKATEGMPVGMGIKPINLNKGIYKPELTMEEMLKVKDIPTVDRVKQSIDLVGEKEFEKMVNAQYKKYKPSDQDQEAMLVESVTLNILGKAQRSPYPQQAALDLAQQRAALPVGMSIKDVGKGMVKEIPKKSSLLDMTRTPSEAEIKKLSREDLINWLQNNDPNGQYLDPTPNPSISMYQTARGYNIEDLETGRVFEFGDYNKAKQEFDALRYAASEFQPMTLQEAQESAINYLREFAQPAESGKVLNFTDPFGNTIGSSIR